ncbi:MAG: Gfo/Idh/MocA family oxidoreductase [bacterium]|nr:Gfo/Idh/MocA family oxidoreductase [bacterium]
MSIKVAVIGASGIGLHHARWHHLSGSEVVGFVGTSPDSNTRTASRLQNDFGFSGRSYTDVKEMLTCEKPELVDVCSPFENHREHVIMALDAGCHVVCEKPLCWDMTQTLDEILTDGAAMLEAVHRASGELVMSAQYPASIPYYKDLYIRERGAWDEIESVYMEMEVKGRKGQKSGEDIWIDLATHPLSLARGFLPGFDMDWRTARCVISGRENRAVFDCLRHGKRCQVEFVLRDIDSGTPVRRFGVNSFLVDWTGYADENAIYRAKLSRGEQAIACSDFMHVLIQDFTRHISGQGGHIWVTAQDAFQNLKDQIELLKLARQA